MSPEIDAPFVLPFQKEHCRLCNLFALVDHCTHVLKHVIIAFCNDFDWFFNKAGWLIIQPECLAVSVWQCVTTNLWLVVLGANTVSFMQSQYTLDLGVWWNCESISLCPGGIFFFKHGTFLRALSEVKSRPLSETAQLLNVHPHL